MTTTVDDCEDDEGATRMYGVRPDGGGRTAAGVTMWRALAAVGLAAVLAGCGGGARRMPGGSSGAVSGPAAPGAPTSTRGGAASDAAVRYAAFYRVNGRATVAAGQPLAMKAADFTFSPNTLTVKAGTPVHLNVDNVSSEAHNFALPSQGVNVNLPAGTTTTVTFTPARPGTYYFYCNLPGHAQAGMVGKLTVS